MTKFFIFQLILTSLIASGRTVTISYVNSSDLPGLEYLDKTVDPCDNFYKFTCGNYKNVNPLPDGEQIWDHFAILQKELHDLMTEILKSNRERSDPISLQKAKAAYKACINVNYSDQLAKHELPQVAVLRKLNGWPLISLESDAEFSWESVGDLVAEYGVPLIFNLQVGPNIFNASETVIWIQRDTLANPSTINGRIDEPLDHYLDHPDLTLFRSNEDTTIPFERFVREIAYELSRIEGTWKSKEEINAEVKEMLVFMRDLQKGGITDDAEFTMLASTSTIKQLQEWTDEYFPHMGLDWVNYLNRVFRLSGVKVTEDMHTSITSTTLIYGVLNLIRKTEPRLIKNLLMTRLFTYMAPDTNYYMRNAFDTYYKEQNYVVYPRDKYCLRKILGYPSFIDLSLALTYEYQRYYYNINQLRKAAEMVEDLQSSFDEIIKQSDWIDDATKEKALKKSSQMYTLLGFPLFVSHVEQVDRYYENLRICEWDHFGNSQRLRAMRQAIQFAQMGKPRNRELWNLSPLEVNAFYNRPNNRILFPIAIINPIFFNGFASVLDYGRIGAIIGHEITHGFDNSGMSYDEDGNYVGKWWSDKTLEEFQKRIDCFVDQYNQYYIDEIDVYVNGTKTLNENLADNGGLKEAYRAFKKLVERTDQLVAVEEYSLEQLFFIGFGTMWCMDETNYYLQTMHDKNTYSPGRYRVIGSITNMKEFADAFNCPSGSNMNPVDKCSLW